MYEFPFQSESMTYQTSGGDTLYPVSQLRDLGVTISDDLGWSAHVNTLASKARSVASWVLSAFKSRDQLTMLTLYKSIIRSHLEYCCPLWNCQKVADMKLIENVQRTFTSKIMGVQHLNYWQRLKSLGLMSLQRRRERYVIIHVWKIYNGTCPNDIDIRFHPSSRHGIRAQVPTLSKSSSLRNQTMYDASFAVIGPRLWNCIPPHLHAVADPIQFKIKLTEFLLTIPDNPPTCGYSSVNNNSMLEWTKNMNAAVQQGRSEKLMTL